MQQLVRSAAILILAAATPLFGQQKPTVHRTGDNN